MTTSPAALTLNKSAQNQVRDETDVGAVASPLLSKVSKAGSIEDIEARESVIVPVHKNQAYGFF